MAEAFNYNQLAKQYGLEPIPESVLRLTQLVARQDADLDDIAKLIVKDPALTARLLRTANPKAEEEADYSVTTVEAALMRNGMGCVLLLAMGTPLTMALVKTFQTMLGAKLETANPKMIPQFTGSHLLGTIGFSGKASGQVFLRMSQEGARFVGTSVLGLSAEELDNTAITDAVGELLNIVTGNFKSNLCDAGLACRLTTPSVSRTDSFAVHTVPGGGLERMAFTSPQITLFVDVSVNPWSD